MKLKGIAAREMRRRPGRTLLTVLGIAIGVAAIVSVETTVDTARQAHRTMFEAIAGKADLEVVADGMGPLPPSLARVVAETEGVAHALPVVQGFVDPVAVDVSMSESVVQITIDAIEDMAPSHKRRFATVAIPREQLMAALGSHLRERKDRGGPARPRLVRSDD